MADDGRPYGHGRNMHMAREALTARVPFAIGSVDGRPAVSILSAFIQDASITNAKIGSVAVDKLTAGTIDAISMQLGGYLWNGLATSPTRPTSPGSGLA